MSGFCYLFTITCLAVSNMLLAYWCRDLAKRLSKIEHVIFMRDWLESIEKGESCSDLAYMKEKGFLK